jgi:hypothetical protein
MPELQYLDFDFSDEESGRGSFDAMASVLPDRLPALLAEIGAVLQWAGGVFGAGGAEEDESEWGYELQGVAEPDTPLNAMYDEDSGAVTLTPNSGQARITLTLTLSGSTAFCAAFRERFGVGD